ncbi:MAG: hypothetical protein KJ722_07200, partial [Candidatus Omnitrophica bacterium]|nr:hypothetical protein [Candidatus Omnitrophota bacterium]
LAYAGIGALAGGGVGYMVGKGIERGIAPSIETIAEFDTKKQIPETPSTPAIQTIAEFGTPKTIPFPTTSTIVSGLVGAGAGYLIGGKDNGLAYTGVGLVAGGLLGYAYGTGAFSDTLGTAGKTNTLLAQKTTTYGDLFRYTAVKSAAILIEGFGTASKEKDLRDEGRSRGLTGSKLDDFVSDGIATSSIFYSGLGTTVETLGSSLYQNPNARWSDLLLGGVEQGVLSLGNAYLRNTLVKQGLDPLTASNIGLWATSALRAGIESDAGGATFSRRMFGYIGETTTKAFSFGGDVSITDTINYYSNTAKLISTARNGASASYAVALGQHFADAFHYGAVENLNAVVPHVLKQGTVDLLQNLNILNKRQVDSETKAKFEEPFQKYKVGELSYDELQAVLGAKGMRYIPADEDMGYDKDYFSYVGKSDGTWAGPKEGTVWGASIKLTDDFNTNEFGEAGPLNKKWLIPGKENILGIDKVGSDNAYFSRQQQKDIEDFYGLSTTIGGNGRGYQTSWGYFGDAGQVYNSAGWYRYAANGQNILSLAGIKDTIISHKDKRLLILQSKVPVGSFTGLAFAGGEFGSSVQGAFNVQSNYKYGLVSKGITDSQAILKIENTPGMNLGLSGRIIKASTTGPSGPYEGFYLTPKGEFHTKIAESNGKSSESASGKYQFDQHTFTKYGMDAININGEDDSFNWVGLAPHATAGDTVYYNGPAGQMSITDWAGRQLVYDSYEGGYKFIVTSSMDLWHHPEGGHGQIRNFGTSKNPTQVGPTYWAADNADTALLKSVQSTGLSTTDGGWVKTFAPKDVIFKNKEQSLTLKKGTEIMFAATGAVASLGEGSNYITGNLGPQGLADIDLSDQTINGRVFSTPYLLTVGGAQYIFMAGETNQIKPKYIEGDQSDQLFKKQKGTSIDGKTNEPAKPYGVIEASLNEKDRLATAGKEGMHIGVDLISGSMNLGQGLYYAVNNPQLKHSVTFETYNNDKTTLQDNKGIYTWGYEKGAFYGYAKAGQTSPTWYGVSADLLRTDTVSYKSGALDENNHRVELELNAPHTKVAFNMKGETSWENLKKGSTAGKFATIEGLNRKDGTITNLMADNGNLYIKTAKSDQYIFMAGETNQIKPKYIEGDQSDQLFKKQKGTSIDGKTNEP